MLVFEILDGSRTIQITCDDAGIDALVSLLLSMKGSGSHVHFRERRDEADRFGHLSAVTPWGDPAVTEVIISHGGN